MLSSLPPPIRSTAELLAMARAMERAAAGRYRALAAGMRLRGAEQLAALFDLLATIEEKHAVEVERRAASLGARPAAAEDAAGDVPETFDEEEGSSRVLTPYRALAVAVRNEDRAFAFYSYIAAQAPDAESRHVAEMLAKDELGHATLLRRERRKAYRNEIGSRRLGGMPGSIDELLALCCEAEQRAARYHRMLAETLPGAAESGFAEAAEDEESCARAAAERIGRDVPDQPLATVPTIAGGLRLLEEAFNRYADIADRAQDEAILHEAQLLAERAVRRLSLVHDTLRTSRRAADTRGSR